MDRWLAPALLLTACRAVRPEGLDSATPGDPYADEVVVFDAALDDDEPTTPHLGAANALGAPDYDGVYACSSQAACTFVSLGDGGSLTLEFTDNALSGSGDDAPDLRVHEVGPDVEDPLVEISADGLAWYSGPVASTWNIDIDAWDLPIETRFAYVRLADDRGRGQPAGRSVGADIDAVESLAAGP